MLRKAVRKFGTGLNVSGERLGRMVRPMVMLPAFLALCLSGGFGRATADDLVKAEGVLTPQSGFARLVLKFSEDVPTEVSVAGSILIADFKKPVDLDIDRMSGTAPAYVGTVRRDPDGTALRIALNQKIHVNTMVAGERLFIDLLPEKWAGPPPPLPPEVVKELSDRAIAAERELRLRKQAEELKKRPPVRVRASVQPTFVRLVFELPDGVAASSSLSVDKFSVVFSTPLTFDLADVKVAMPANIQSVEQKADGSMSRIDIGLIGDVDVHSFREEKNLIVDVAFDQSQKPLQQSTTLPLPSASAPPARSSVPGDKSSAASPPDSEQIAREAKIEIKPGEVPPRRDAKPDTDKVEKTEAAVPAASAAVGGVVVPAPRETTSPAPGQQPAVLAKAQPDMPAPVQAKAAPQTQAAPAPFVAQPASLPAGNTIRPQVERITDGLRVTFPFAAAPPAAVFRRTDSVWMIFDTNEAIDAARIQTIGGAIVAGVATLDLQGARALRIRLNRPQLVSLTGDDHAWTLTVSDKIESQTQPLAVVRNNGDAGRANVSIVMAKPGQFHRFVDPDAGDVLMVMTAGAPVSGFTRRQDFVEFSLLESIHGVVVLPNADDLLYNVAVGKIVLSRPDGLTLSSGMAAPRQSFAAARPIFDVNEWRDDQKEEFIPARDSLLAAAAQSEPDKRLSSHLKLARFYMARGFYPEAKGVLDLMRAETKAGDENAATLVLHAVASALAGRPKLAQADLSNPVVGTNYDSQLWKALVSARQENWADAREKFKNVDFAIAAQPVDLQRLLLIDAFRSALEVKDYAGAGTYGNELDVIGLASEQDAPVALLRGRLDEALGRENDALMEFQKAAASPNRYAAAEGQLRSVALRQKRKEITDDDALQQLETLSAVWRGDEIEARTLQMLSKLYADKARYQDAFAAARTATKLQGNSDAARKLQDDVAELFEQIYNGPKGDDLPPIKALAMFYEYRDMVPAGRHGDEMIRRLADRLVAVDLLDQAGELLQYQVDKRLEGAARAQVASKLAMVYLMNHKPERAIAALHSTRIADLAGELRQQRLLLEARAQSDIGRHDLALELVSNLNGREVTRLRSDIFWAARRWRESAEQIELLYGDRWRDFQPLSALEKGDIIRAAIAYALAEDSLGLARFREKYSAKMDSEGDRTAFDMASKPATANSTDFARIAKMAAAVDTLSGFMRELKMRFPESGPRTKSPTAAGVDMNTTGSLPEIVGRKPVHEAAR